MLYILSTDVHMTLCTNCCILRTDTCCTRSFIPHSLTVSALVFQLFYCENVNCETDVLKPGLGSFLPLKASFFRPCASIRPPGFSNIHQSHAPKKSSGWARHDQVHLGLWERQKICVCGSISHLGNLRSRGVLCCSEMRLTEMCCILFLTLTRHAWKAVPKVHGLFWRDASPHLWGMVNTTSAIWWHLNEERHKRRLTHIYKNIFCGVNCHVAFVLGWLANIPLRYQGLALTWSL